MKDLRIVADGPLRLAQAIRKAVESEFSELIGKAADQSELQRLVEKREEEIRERQRREISEKMFW